MKHFLVFLLILLSSCRQTLIPKNDFISILTDIYLSKAFFSAEGLHDPRWLDTVAYNEHIVQRHGYKWAQFDSTLSWYCSKPVRYIEIYETVMANLEKLEKIVAIEPDPPSELWTGRRSFSFPSDGRQGSVSVNLPLNGAGSYVISAKIRIHPKDASLNPHIALYLWRTDSINSEVADTLWMAPLRKDGLMYEYRMEKTVHVDSEFEYLRGNWLNNSNNHSDTAWIKNADIRDISVFHTPTPPQPE